MVFESRPIERLREHVGPIFVGFDVFHLDVPLCNPFLQLELAPLDVPRERKAFAPFGYLDGAHVIHPQHGRLRHVVAHFGQ